MHRRSQGRNRALIQEAHEATKSLKNEELADWGKETAIWRETVQGEVLNFDSYAKLLGRDSPESNQRGTNPSVRGFILVVLDSIARRS